MLKRREPLQFARCPEDKLRTKHEQIGDPTLADGILDRLVDNAHRIELRGGLMRKNRGKPHA